MRVSVNATLLPLLYERLNLAIYDCRMANEKPSERRKARRIGVVARVRFLINGSAMQTGATMDMTARSLAIRSDAKVQLGDAVTIYIADLSALSGSVIRVFPEGFGVRLSAASISLVAHTLTSELCLDEHNNKTPNSTRCISPLNCLGSEQPAWARFATTLRTERSNLRHSYTIITTSQSLPENISSAWLTIKDIRWVARISLSQRRGDALVVTILLNDWQLDLAADNDFSVMLSFKGDEPLALHGKAKHAWHHREALDWLYNPYAARLIEQTKSVPPQHQAAPPMLGHAHSPA